MKLKIAAIISILAVSLMGCGSGPSEEEREADLNMHASIVNNINDGNYEEALSALEENYGAYDSIEDCGTHAEDFGAHHDEDNVYIFEKATLYRLYFDKQKMYDEEMTVLLNGLKTHDFKAILKDSSGESDAEAEKTEVRILLESAAAILDKVSPALKEEMVSLAGEDLLEEYGTKGEQKNE